jgi:dUTP pyrophosphatase
MNCLEINGQEKNQMTEPVVKYFKIDESAKAPVKGTDFAACYDVHACFHERYVKARDSLNRPVELDAWYSSYGGQPKNYKHVSLEPRHRCLIPTGLIFDIPEGYSVRIHPRSGIAWKEGVTVANCEGVVDSDYYHETFIMLINHSGYSFVMNDGDRIAQIEIVKDSVTVMEETNTAPTQKTNRQGGFGHTGV